MLLKMSFRNRWDSAATIISKCDLLDGPKRIVQTHCLSVFYRLKAFHEELKNKFLSVSVKDGNAPNTFVGTADGIFIANNFQVKSEYRDQVLGRVSSSVIENVDFQGNAQGATGVINKLVPTHNI